MSLQTQQELTRPHIVSSVSDVTNQLPITPPFRIVLKNDLEQPSGSFKLRGIGNLIYTNLLANPGKKCHVYASSGGNAGLAAAYSAKYYNIPCTVVLPTTSKKSVQEQLVAYNADIILFGNSIFEADNYLKTLIESVDKKITPIYCHPFNNPQTWKGHSSIIDELVSQVEPSKIKGIVCSCGGGGLYNGIFEGIEKHDLDTKILLIETKQAPTLYQSVRENKLITLKSVNSVATSLACSYTTQKSIDNYNSSKVTTSLELIDDKDSIRGCVDYYQNQHKIVEPACGASVSVVYNKFDLLMKNFQGLKHDDVVVVVVCGGSCTSEDDIQQYQKLIKRDEYKL